MSRPETLTSQELSTPVDILADRFIQRFDKYPRQAEDGSYFTVEKPLNRRLLYAHLRGEITLGTYLLDENSQGRFMVLDADDEPDRRRLLALSRVLTGIGCPSTYEASRRGGHLWFFFNHPLPGEEIRRFGKGMMGHFQPGRHRAVPQAGPVANRPWLPDSPPLWHPQEERPALRVLHPGRRAAGADDSGAAAGAENARDGAGAVLDLYNGYVSVPVEKPEFEPVEVEGERVSDRIKAAASCYEFVSRYVELDRRGRGLCPFHDDRVASFSVHPDHDYWHCFAGCGAGDQISFYMTYQQRVEGRECDFKTAVTELAEMLLK